MNCSVKGIAMASLLAITHQATAADGCGAGEGQVNILSNDFPALHAVAAQAEGCTTNKLSVTKNQTKDHRDLQNAALKANPAKYSTAIVSTSSIVPLLNEGLIQPLDDMVEKYGQSLQPSQLIKIDGKVMAVAFMANSQHLFYRKDILEKAGVEPPKTFEDMIAAGKKIQQMGLMKYPVALNTKTGWNLGEEFINVFSATGESFFKPGSAIPNLNNANGVKTLNTLKALTELSNPDFLTFDSNSTQALWEDGKVALALLWGSRATAILDGEGSSPEIVANTVLTNTPVFSGSSTPGATLWWDGWTVASNLSPQDAEATFKVMTHAISTEMMQANQEKAVWLIEGYEPDPSAMGVIATVQEQANPYPMLPYMGLLHSALGAELPDFLLGNESAEQALKDIEAAYMTSAREQGFL